MNHISYIHIVQTHTCCRVMGMVVCVFCMVCALPFTARAEGGGTSASFQLTTDFPNVATKRPQASESFQLRGAVVWEQKPLLASASYQITTDPAAAEEADAGDDAGGEDDAGDITPPRGGGRRGMPSTDGSTDWHMRKTASLHPAAKEKKAPQEMPVTTRTHREHNGRTVQKDGGVPFAPLTPQGMGRQIHRLQTRNRNDTIMNRFQVIDPYEGGVQFFNAHAILRTRSKQFRSRLRGNVLEGGESSSIIPWLLPFLFVPGIVNWHLQKKRKMRRKRKGKRKR